MTRVAAMRRRPRGRRTAKTTASPATQGGSPVPRNVQSPSATTKNVTPGHRSTISGSSLTNAMMVYPITIVTARTKYMYIPQTTPQGGKFPRRAPDANDNTAIRIPVAPGRPFPRAPVAAPAAPRGGTFPRGPPAGNTTALIGPPAPAGRFPRGPRESPLRGDGDPNSSVVI